MTVIALSGAFWALGVLVASASTLETERKRGEGAPTGAPESYAALENAGPALPVAGGVMATPENVSPPGPEFAKLRPVARKVSYPTAAHARLANIRPKLRPYFLPATRWEHKPGHKRWTRAAMQAVLSHGRPLVQTVPSDYRDWCPAYRENDAKRRAMFWVGFMSALAKHESTYRSDAVGGGGLWYGLLQILPSTAELYRCEARTGEALKDGALNLSCAARIMAKTVARDRIIHGFFPGQKRRYRGITQDWGPMHSSAKRRDMAQWTRQQSYCISRRSLRPVVRPESLVRSSGSQ